MPTIPFIKVHTAGHDFVVVIDPDGELELTSVLVRTVCDRYRGVGAAGIIRAVRTASMSENSHLLEVEPEAEWFLDHWNADGTQAALSGSAILAYAHVLISRGLVVTERRDTLPIATKYGIRDVLQGTSGYTVDLGRWRLGQEQLMNVDGLRVARPALSIHIGEPHAVTVLADESDLARLQLERAPELDAISDEPVNSVFVAPEPTLLRNGVAQIRLRTYAHDVGELLSSANAAAAAALVFRHWGGDQMPHHWSVETPGGKLAVRMFPTEEGEHVSVSSPVETVLTGEYELPE